MTDAFTQCVGYYNSIVVFFRVASFDDNRTAYRRTMLAGAAGASPIFVWLWARCWRHATPVEGSFS